MYWVHLSASQSEWERTISVGMSAITRPRQPAIKRCSTRGSPLLVAGFFMRCRMAGMSDPLVHARLVRLVTTYCDGIYLSGELWHQMAAALQGQDIAGTLDELPAGLKDALREGNRDRIMPTEDQAFQEFKQWCLRDRK